MHSSVFKRSKTRLDGALKKSGDALIATEPLRLHVPERYAERNLAIIEYVSYVLGFFALITEDNYYASSLVPSMMRTEPDRVGRCVVDDVSYIELYYDKGSRVIADINLVMVGNLVHRIWTENIGRAHIPWYYGYEDLPLLFRETGKYNGLQLGSDEAVKELVAAQIARDPDDPTRFYRQIPDAKKQLRTKPPIFIGSRNVSLTATNVATRLPGSYSDEGLTVSLVNPAQRAERIETALRSTVTVPSNN